MLKFKNYNITTLSFLLYASTVFSFILFLFISIDIYSQYNNQILIMFLLFSLVFILLINGYIRHVKLKNQTKYKCISLLFSICAAAMLQYFVLGIAATISMFCLLFDIFRFEKKVIKTFIPIHFLLYFLVSNLHIELINNMNILLNLLFVNLLAYLGIAGMLYYQKTLEIEKEEVKQLNEKLKLANMKLQEYALEVEEVTISKERTRVSQELHDSLGHSLMALAMHLEFARKICTTNPQKVEEVLVQSEKIAKSSINDLRKAVTLLNSELEIKDFSASMEKLINNFYLVSNLKINYNKNKNINNLSPIIKTSIYKTIQESITNSLKHGYATEINIKIKTISKNLELIITDNGIGCNDIIKSNGLNGIENRITSLGGTTYYFSHNDLGFGIKVFIPI